MLKSVKQIVKIILFAMLLSSCGEEDLSVISGEKAVIHFSPQVENAAPSPRAEPISTGTLKNFGVYATVDAATPYLLMENELIYKNTDSNWIYDNIKYWPLNQTVSFLAYSPYGNDNISFSYENNKITGTIPDDPEDQFDLMAARAPGKSSTTGVIGLQFKHLLSRIDFNVSTENNQENIRIKLNKFRIIVKEDAVYNSGEYNLTTDTWHINNTSYMSRGDYELLQTDTPVPDEGWNYSMMLLPQEHRAGNITVDIAYTIVKDDTSTIEKQTTIPLQQIVCEHGKKYTYNFKISLTGMTLEVGVLPWNSGGWGSIVYPDNP